MNPFLSCFSVKPKPSSKGCCSLEEALPVPSDQVSASQIMVIASAPGAGQRRWGAFSFQSLLALLQQPQSEVGGVLFADTPGGVAIPSSFSATTLSQIAVVAPSAGSYLLEMQVQVNNDGTPSVDIDARLVLSAGISASSIVGTAAVYERSEDSAPPPAIVSGALAVSAAGLLSAAGVRLPFPTLGSPGARFQTIAIRLSFNAAAAGDSISVQLQRTGVSFASTARSYSLLTRVR